MVPRVGRSRRRGHVDRRVDSVHKALCPLCDGILEYDGANKANVFDSDGALGGNDVVRRRAKCLEAALIRFVSKDTPAMLESDDMGLVLLPRLRSLSTQSTINTVPSYYWFVRLFQLMALCAILVSIVSL